MNRPASTLENPLRLASEAPRGKIKTPSLSATAAEKTWQAAFRGSFTGTTGGVMKSWTAVDKAKFAACLGKTWQGRPEQLHELVGWSVENWARLMTSTFRWMIKRLPPATPELGFFLCHRERFLDAFNRNIIAADREKLSDYHEREMHELVTERGYTRDEAFKSVARDQAVGIIREEIDTAKREFAQQRRVLQLHEQEMVRRFGNKPLPHRNALPPRSVEPAAPAVHYEPYDSPPLFDMPEWDEAVVAPVNPVAK